MADHPERIAVVDDENRFLRWEPRPVIHQQQLVHRSIHVAVFDSQSRLVIQRRHRDKDTYPRHWDISCSGHVDEADYPGDIDATRDVAYLVAAGRELAEELGISAPPVFVGHFAPMRGVHYEQIQLFCATSDGPFVLEPTEIEELRRVSANELADIQARGEPLTRTLVLLSDWLRAEGRWTG